MAIAGRTPDRYHALDALRGAAMFLGILLHAAIPYMKHPLPFWPLRDSRRCELFDACLAAVHDFRMQLFFLLAGFFGCLLYTRHGLRHTAGHRFKRIAIPLAVALLTIQPLLQAVSIYAAADLPPSSDEPAPTFFEQELPAAETPEAAVAEHFSIDGFLRFFLPTHLWFLWFLLLCFAIMLPLAWLGDRLRHRDIGWRWDGAIRWLFCSRMRWAILALATLPLLVPMNCPAGPETAIGWAPPPYLLAYYFIFFLVGWSLYRHRDLLERFTAGWKGHLAIGQLLVLPAALVCLFWAIQWEKLGRSEGPPWQSIAMVLLAIYTWLSIGGLMGLFLNRLSRERVWIRWLADSSYWCYLTSMPLIVFLNYVAIDWPVPAIVKFWFVSAASLLVLLTLYQSCVRYTWIGVMLNGPRTRPAAKTLHPDDQVPASV